MKPIVKSIGVLSIVLLLSLHSSAEADELGRAWELLHAGEREKAKELAALSLANARDETDRGKAFLICALSEVDGERAASQLKQFLSDFPNHPLEWHAQMHLGFSCYARGIYGRAGQHFGQAAELRVHKNKQAEARYWLGLALLGAGDPGKAKEHFESVLTDKVKTDLAEGAALGLADCLREEGRYSDALSEYTRVVTKYARGEWVPCALYGAGVCLEKLQREKEALEVYSRLAEKYSASFEATIVRDRIKDLGKSDVVTRDRRNYTVQLGAFSEESNANGLAARLKEKGVVDVRIAKEGRGGRTLYIVSLGEFSTKEAAEQKGKELSTRFGLSYSIVSR